MTIKSKNLSNPFSTGGGGGHFEAHVQASFVVLMLTGGFIPCLPCWPIQEIKLQGKIDGYDTDDLIVTIGNEEKKEQRKLLGQIKHSIKITQGDTTFGEVMYAAWKDFNNSEVFSKGKDCIALITGPLSSTDANNVQWLLNQARHTKNAVEFHMHVKQGKFSPPKSVEKLQAIKHHLTNANGGVALTDDDIYEFLNHFYLLGYDFGKEIGVVLSLIHSHISQFNSKFPHWIWPRVVDLVQVWNHSGGTITLENLPDDLKEAFSQKAISYIPLSLAKPAISKSITDWNSHPYASELALASLVGAWDEQNDTDKAVLATILSSDYKSWISKARDVLSYTNSPLHIKNGKWKITNRGELLKQLGPKIFDEHLESFKLVAISVLTEKSPAFELSSEERYAASVSGKVLQHSKNLRKNVAETLAILGNLEGPLAHSSDGKVGSTVAMAVHSVLKNADWILWGSLNELLPTLAEAAPSEFLDSVEASLRNQPSPFDELFRQESAGPFGGNYLTGLFWALEGLAWEETYFVRVCVILADIAQDDPGGRYANRPGNSIVDILLPWHPQTFASIEKRITAIQAIRKDFPDVAWSVLLKLLPGKQDSTSGTYKPIWRNPVPEDWKPDVTDQEYWDVISRYAELVVDMASESPARTKELVSSLDSLPESAFERFLVHLSSSTIINLEEQLRSPIWEKLQEFVRKHRRFSDANWALPADLVTQVAHTAEYLKPHSLILLNAELFSARDHDLYDEIDNYEEQQKALDDRRTKAISAMLSSQGIDAVIHLADFVKSPAQVGTALASISNSEMDSVLLPKYLIDQSKNLVSFARNYVFKRYLVLGWNWVDALNIKNWSMEQIVSFLIGLPFELQTWQRAELWLKDREGEYWKSAHPFPHDADSGLEIAVNKLIQFGRPHAAIDCLRVMRYQKMSFGVDLAIDALKSAISSEEPPESADRHSIIELIKYLQKSPDSSEDQLSQIEWAYLSILNRLDQATPLTLERKLGTDPDFFCEVIRTIYRSRNEEKRSEEPDPEKQSIASHAWRLLHDWQTTPGTGKDGTFDGKQFLDWLSKVRGIANKSGHLEVTMITIGEMLAHAPADPDGLWIHRSIADALNGRESQELRRGYVTGVHNSRGVHWVDPTGNPELELASSFELKATQVEDAGYTRLAASLREIAEGYERDAQRIISRQTHLHEGD